MPAKKEAVPEKKTVSAPTSADDFNDPMVYGVLKAVREEDVVSRDGEKFFYSDNSPKRRLVLGIEHPWNTSPNAREPITEVFLNIPEKLEKGCPLHAMLEAINKKLRPMPLKFKEWDELIGYGFNWRQIELAFNRREKPYRMRVPFEVLHDVQGRTPTDADFGQD